jgi:hypothetical protein
MAIVLQSTGGGSVSIQEPTTASNFTQTLPASTGTILTTGSPQSGGVIQVVNFQNIGSTFSTTSTSFASTSITLTITPKFSTSKIFLIFNSVGENSSTNVGGTTVYRNGSNIAGSGNGMMYQRNYGGTLDVPTGFTYLDSPATTSALTYTIYILTSGGTFAFGSGGGSVNNTATTFTAMEIAQ